MGLHLHGDVSSLGHCLPGCSTRSGPIFFDRFGFDRYDEERCNERKERLLPPVPPGASPEFFRPKLFLAYRIKSLVYSLNTTKLVTSGGAHLNGLAPGQHSFGQDMS